MNNFFLANGSVFRQIFYTTSMVYDRREQEPFPPVNVYVCDGHVLVQALLPGLDTHDIGIAVDGEELLLEGRMQRKNGRYVREERYSGHFRRRIPLGTAVHPQANVKIKDGILHIEFKRKDR